MKVYEHIQIEDGAFATEKQFLTIKLSCDKVIQNKNLVLKSFKAYSPDRIVLYDDFLEHGVTFIHTLREQSWVFDYNGYDIITGSVVVFEIKFFEDKQFSEIYLVKTGLENQSWKNGLVYDGVDDRLIRLEGYDILRQYWKLDT